MSNSNQEIGQWGEELACKHLEKKGYKIIDRNFRRKWGEIDIVCEAPLKSSNLKEIGKDVPRGTLASNEKENVPRGTFMNWLKSVLKDPEEKKAKDNHILKSDKKVVFVEVKTLQTKSLRPEDNITGSKRKQLIKSCQLYLSHNSYPIDTDWQIDVIGILLDKTSGKAKINHIEQAVYFV